MLLLLWSVWGRRSLLNGNGQIIAHDDRGRSNTLYKLYVLYVETGGDGRLPKTTPFNN